MLLVSSFGGERFRVGPFAMGWLFATATVIGLGLGPVIAYFATVDAAALTQAAAGTAATVAGCGALGLRAVEGPRAVDAPAVAGRVRGVHRHGIWSLAAGAVPIWVSLIICGCQRR